MKKLIILMVLLTGYYRHAEAGNLDLRDRALTSGSYFEELRDVNWQMIKKVPISLHDGDALILDKSALIIIRSPGPLLPLHSTTSFSLERRNGFYFYTIPGFSFIVFTSKMSTGFVDRKILVEKLEGSGFILRTHPILSDFAVKKGFNIYLFRPTSDSRK